MLPHHGNSIMLLSRNIRLSNHVCIWKSLTKQSSVTPLTRPRFPEGFDSQRRYLHGMANMATCLISTHFSPARLGSSSISTCPTIYTPVTPPTEPSENPAMHTTHVDHPGALVILHLHGRPSPSAIPMTASPWPTLSKAIDQSACTYLQARLPVL